MSKLFNISYFYKNIHYNEGYTSFLSKYVDRNVFDALVFIFLDFETFPSSLFNYLKIYFSPRTKYWEKIKKRKPLFEFGRSGVSVNLEGRASLYTSTF